MPSWRNVVVAVSGGVVVGIATYYMLISVCSKNQKRKFNLSTKISTKNGITESRRIIILGLAGSGKSSIISRFSKVDKEKRKVNPTKGFNVLCIQSSKVTYNFWEIGGEMKSYWVNFIEETDLLVYVVDSTDSEPRLEETVSEFNKLLSDKRLSQTKVLLLANKQDLPGAKSSNEIEKRFGCHGGFVQDHPVRCLGTVATLDDPSHPSITKAERLMLSMCVKRN